MNWKDIHPIRAFLAVGTLLATFWFLQTGVVIPEAWWFGLGMVWTFYFTMEK